MYVCMYLAPRSVRQVEKSSGAERPYDKAYVVAPTVSVTGSGATHYFPVVPFYRDDHDPSRLMVNVRLVCGGERKGKIDN